jgi:hypothetical protein
MKPSKKIPSEPIPLEIALGNWNYWDYIEPWDLPLTPPRKKRKPRKSSLISAIKAARKAGVNKGTVTVGGVSVTFGESESTAAVNPWLADIDRATKQ